MLKLKRRNCKICGKPALQNRAICFHCLVIDRRAKAERKRLRERTKAHKDRQKAIEKAGRERLHNSYRYLMKKAWGLQSKYVRSHAADENGDVICYTCGDKLPWKESQLGHYLHDRLDFDLKRNLRIQCSGCNCAKFGNKNLAIYGIKLAQELGVEGMKKLLLDANTFGNGYSCQQLKDIILTYQNEKIY